MRGSLEGDDESSVVLSAVVYVRRAKGVCQTRRGATRRLARIYNRRRTTLRLYEPLGAL